MVVNKTPPSGLLGAFSQFKADSQAQKRHHWGSSPGSQNSNSDQPNHLRKPSKKKGCHDHHNSDSSRSDEPECQKKKSKKTKEPLQDDTERAEAEHRCKDGTLKKALAMLCA